MTQVHKKLLKNLPPDSSCVEKKRSSILMLADRSLAVFSLRVYFTRIILLEPLAKTSGIWSGCGVNWHQELFEIALEASLTSLCVLTGNSWTCLWVLAGVGEGLTRKWCQRGFETEIGCLSVCVCVCVCACVRIVSVRRFDVRRPVTHSEVKYGFCNRGDRDG
jgi:hypothetical protein